MKYLNEAKKFEIKKHGLLKYLFCFDMRRVTNTHSHINQTTGQPKYAHDTVESAIKEAARMEKVTGRKINYYLCAYCGKYHIGNEVKRA